MEQRSMPGTLTEPQNTALNPSVSHETIVVLDFGSQFSMQIGRAHV